MSGGSGALAAFCGFWGLCWFLLGSGPVSGLAGEARLVFSRCNLALAPGTWLLKFPDTPALAMALVGTQQARVADARCALRGDAKSLLLHVLASLQSLLLFFRLLQA